MKPAGEQGALFFFLKNGFLRGPHLLLPWDKSWTAGRFYACVFV